MGYNPSSINRLLNLIVIPRDTLWRQEFEGFKEKRETTKK